jgi:hypothetical protein
MGLQAGTVVDQGLATGRLIRHSGQKNLARKSMNKQKGQVVDQGQETGTVSIKEEADIHLR